MRAGGVIPVVVEAGRVRGVKAVIDKDLAAALLTRRLDARLLLTDVPAVELDGGTPRARPPHRRRRDSARQAGTTVAPARS
jgi:carbamate kinase